METMNGFLYFFITVILLIFIICYAFLAIFLNNFHKKIYGQSTVMAWIPLANIYLLGKLTFGKDVGYGLVALFLLSCTLTMRIDRMTIVLSLPDILQMILGAIFSGSFVATIIFAIKKYGKLKTNNKNNETKEIEKIVKENNDFFNS